jgi:hypothetical protein
VSSIGQIGAVCFLNRFFPKGLTDHRLQFSFSSFPFMRANRQSMMQTPTVGFDGVPKGTSARRIGSLLKSRGNLPSHQAFKQPLFPCPSTG